MKVVDYYNTIILVNSIIVLIYPNQKADDEKHVILTDTTAQKFEREKDGKKICWNFRKGRCYKGHNCALYHDGDLKVTRKELTGDERPNYRNASRGPSDNDIKRMLEKDIEDDGDPGSKAIRKRKHGLTNSLAPVKGAMRKLEEQDMKSNPHRYSAPSLPKNAIQSSSILCPITA